MQFHVAEIIKYSHLYLVYTGHWYKKIQWFWEEKELLYCSKEGKVCTYTIKGAFFTATKRAVCIYRDFIRAASFTVAK